MQWGWDGRRGFCVTAGSSRAWGQPSPLSSGCGMGSPSPSSAVTSAHHRGTRGQAPLPALYGVSAGQGGARLRGSTAELTLGADGCTLHPTEVRTVSCGGERPIPHPIPHPIPPAAALGFGGALCGRALCSAVPMSPEWWWWWGCTGCGSTGTLRASPSVLPVPTPATTDRRWRMTSSCCRWGRLVPGSATSGEFTPRRSTGPGDISSHASEHFHIWVTSHPGDIHPLSPRAMR